MGVILKSNNYTVTTFLTVQGHWGHKKEKSSQTLNSFFLGTRNDFNIFNPENSVEFLKRLNLFCFDVIKLNGNILFVNTYSYFERITLFFGLRSLESIKLNNWVNGSLSNLLHNKPTVLFISNINNNMYILKEASKKSIPVIGIQDSDISINRITYSILGNNDSKEVFAEYSNTLSNTIIKAKLFNFCKNIV